MKRYVRPLARLCLAACLLSLLPARASAWGGPGHRIVARIAVWRLKQLNARNAQRQINRIYTAQTDQNTDPRNIVTAASWPDSPAVRDNRDYEFANNLHFISIPRGKDKIDASTPCPKTGKVKEGVCITGGIEHFRGILLTTNDRHKRRDALSFIVHFIGDIHQPLHTSEDLSFDNGEGMGDRGGNFRTVCYLDEAVCLARPEQLRQGPLRLLHPSGDKRKRRELHKVWDNFMFETQMDSKHLKLNEEGYAAHLIKTKAEKLTDATLAAIEQGDPAAWAEESHALAKSVAYELPDPLIKKNPDGTLQAHYFVSTQYRDANVGRAEDQLIKSGLRLAFYLRQIFPDN